MTRRCAPLTEPSQILYRPQAGLPVRDRGVQVMLLAVLVNAETFERQVPPRTIVILHGTGKEDRRHHAQVPHAVLHYGELQRDHSRHLDRSAERDFAVALREVEIADAELCTFDVDR